jgi:hypothetical protein
MGERGGAFVAETSRKETTLKNLGVDRRIILKRTFKN